MDSCIGSVEQGTIAIDLGGMTIDMGNGRQLELDPCECMALIEFLRRPGVRRLIGRAWLGQQAVFARSLAEQQPEQQQAPQSGPQRLAA